MDKTGRNGLRVGDVLTPDFKEKYEKLKAKHLQIIQMYDFEFDITEEESEWFESIEELKRYTIVSGEYYVNNALSQGKKILAEGAQGSMLDIDFGTYPFVTSSNTITAGACNGLGVAPNKIKEVIGISKAYCTRVGSGPFPSELHDAVGEQIRSAGHEFGATTGRPRRCGWIDLVALRYAAFLNGVTQIALTKADVLNDFDEIMVCDTYTVNGKVTNELPFELNDDIQCNYKGFKGWKQSLEEASYDSLPSQLQEYVSFLESYMGIPVSMISTGPEREKLLIKQAQLV
jgi:adenylosuccinate synthase